jgi:hypothetical protein
MPKKEDDLSPSPLGSERGRSDDATRGSGIEDIRGIANDEDDDFDDDDDLDEPEDDESEDL